jgi:hypothetical protein
MLKKYFSFCLFLLFFTFAFGQNYSMMIRSASVKRIYRQCENPLYFDVSNLCGEEYQPKVEAKNMEIRQDSFQVNKFYVFPEIGNSCLLRFYNKGKAIASERLMIIESPKPSISIWVNGIPYNKKKMRINKGSKVRISIQADAKFEETLPDEAKYGISGLEIRERAHHGNYLLGKVNFTNSAYRQEMDIPIPTNAFDGNGGKTIYLILENIYRLNSKGECINDKRFTEMEKQITLLTI